MTNTYYALERVIFRQVTTVEKHWLSSAWTKMKPILISPLVYNFLMFKRLKINLPKIVFPRLCAQNYIFSFYLQSINSSLSVVEAPFFFRASCPFLQTSNRIFIFQQKVTFSAGPRFFSLSLFPFLSFLSTSVCLFVRPIFLSVCPSDICMA